MSTSLKITVEQYEAMIVSGEFLTRDEHRVELIHGEIVPINPRSSMSPVNPPHDDAVDELIDWSAEVLPRGAVRIRAQGSISIPQFDSQPQPDFLWMTPRRYHKVRPSPGDILLLIEVSDATLRKDRGVKARLYAESGIQDYWIVNVKVRCVEIRRNPVGSKYLSMASFRFGQTVSSLAFPDVSLTVSRLFPE